LIQAWYCANRGNPKGLVWQSNLVEFNANLKPNGKYQVRSDYGEKFVRFKLVDLDTQEVVAVSREASIILRGLLQSDTIVLPIIIPVRKQDKIELSSLEAHRHISGRQFLPEAMCWTISDSVGLMRGGGK
jgi:hypothetical protein